MLSLTFYGGAGKVTGSNFLLQTANSRILIDCGIEQGKGTATEEMYAAFPYNPATINALIITHAHLDHVGRVPRLVKCGFRGVIYMTPPTRDLAELILRDSVIILNNYAKHHGLQPLYNEDDVDAVFKLTQTLDYHTEKEVAPGLTALLRNTGHILGSASVHIKDANDVAVAITGDIGNSPSPLLPDWEPITDADVIVMESVYGNRTHTGRAQSIELLRTALQQAIARGGAILIPAFSLERTQLMLYELSNFFSAGELPKVPVFLDSPLAIHITAVYEKWGAAFFKKEAEDEMKREKSLFEFPYLTKTLSHEESKSIEKIDGPKIIIAGAGMSHGGRIGKWEQLYLPDHSTTLFMVGYQVPGSPGRRISEGAKSIKIEGKDIPIRAHIENLDGWSAHADYDGLLAFAEASLSLRTKAVFTAIGEPSAERFLAQRIHDYLGARAIVPEYGDKWMINKENVQKVSNDNF